MGDLRCARSACLPLLPFLTATGLGVWATSSTNARIAPSIGQGTEPFQLMLTAKQLPTAEFADYTFVFAH